MERKTSAVLRLVAFGPGLDKTGLFDLAGHGFFIGKRGCHLDLPGADIPDRAIRIRNDGDGLSFAGVDSFKVPLGSISVAEGWIDSGQCLLLQLDPYEVLIEPSEAQGKPIESLEPDSGTCSAGPRLELAVPDPAPDGTDLDATMLTHLPAGPPPRAPLSRSSDPTFQALDIHWRGLAGASSETRVPVATSPFLIGRTTGELVLDDRRVSSKHAQLDVLGPTHFLLMDLASTNGTTVNGRKISASSLKNGDVVAFGGVAFEFVVRPRKPRPQARPVES